MKIRYISSSFLNTRAASNVHVLKMCSALVDEFESVELFCPSYMTEKSNQLGLSIKYGLINNFETNEILVPRNIFWQFVYLYKLFRKLTEKEYVYISRNFLASVIIGGLNLRHIFEVHDDHILKSNIKLHLYKFFVNRKSYVSTVYITKKLQEEYEYKLLHKSKVLPDCADDIDLSPSVKFESLKASYNLAYVGSFNKGKGIELLAKLSHLLVDEHIHIIGGSDTEVRRCKNSFRANNTTFWGMKSQPEIKSIVGNVDAFLLPNQKKVYGVSARENSNRGEIGRYTSPLKMFEYMSHGKPIIASNLPVLKEILNDGNAIFSTADCAQEWYRNIRILRDNKEMGLRLGHNARNDFLNNYTWRIRASKLCDLFKELV
jgi:glycosyltransferase involved in cell wall biosynthesis